MEPIKSTIVGLVVLGATYYIYPMYKEHVSQYKEPITDVTKVSQE